MNFTIDIRPRRQATLPNALLQIMGVSVGDQLEITIKNKQALIKPKKQIALEALKAIQKAFGESGISLKQLQQSD